MTALIVNLIIALALFTFAVTERRVLINKVESSLNKLDHLTTGDCGYFAAVQRYYDSRKNLFLVTIYMFVCSALTYIYSFKVLALLNN